MGEQVFEAPGPGPWELEATHNQRPMSRFAVQAFVAGFPRGFAEGTARYGLLLSHMQPAVVGGFMYTQNVIFGADGSATPEQMQARIGTSAQAFDGKRWREDLAQWEKVDKPDAVAAHRALQDVDPTGLSGEELAEHVQRCRDHLEAMVYLHHKYSATAVAPLGDFLAFAEEHAGVAAGELLQLLRGSTPISNGFAADELDELARAIQTSPTAAAILHGAAEPTETLAALRADPDVAAQARAYLDAVWYRSMGYDVADHMAGEMPELLLEAIRAATAGATAAPLEEPELDAIRERLPVEHRAEFDSRLAEARLINHLRDERGVYADGWAAGLARRAVLEAGRRLHATGRLADPTHAVDLEAAELADLLRGRPGPGADEVAERVRQRTSRTIDDVPPLLGPPPDPPPPLEALPPPARRGMLAAGAVMRNLFQVADAANTETVLHGLAVNHGWHEGTARVIEDAIDFGRIQRGDVLVTRMTSPYFNVVLPLLGAIVTDRGGQLCHAAIVAREYGIPGIVGTREATRLIEDGARVRVDGSTGEVRVLR
jgi:pyruvate,water dikinase